MAQSQIPTGAKSFDSTKNEEQLETIYNELCDNDQSRKLGKKHLVLSESAREKWESESDPTRLDEAITLTSSVYELTSRFQTACARLDTIRKDVKLELDHEAEKQALKVETDLKDHKLELKMFEASDKFVSIAIFSATVPKMDAIGSCDPFIKIKAGQKDLQTEFKPNTLQPQWYQLFSLQNDAHFSRDSPLIFEVHDHDAFGRSKLIGKFEVLLSEVKGCEMLCDVYSKENGESESSAAQVRLQIVKMRAVGDDFRQGMVMNKARIEELELLTGQSHKARVLQPGTPGTPGYVKSQVVHLESKNQDLKMSMLPPESAGAHHTSEEEERPLMLFEESESYYILAMIRAIGLPRMDQVGACDGWVKVLADGREVARTKAKSNTLDPRWDQLFCLQNVQGCSELEFEFWDHNKTAKDDFIGRCRVALNEVDGRMLHLTIYNDDETWSGIAVLQVARANASSRDFKQGMEIDVKYFKELDIIDRQARKKEAAASHEHAFAAPIEEIQQDIEDADFWKRETLVLLSSPLPGSENEAEQFLDDAEMKLKKLEEEIEKLDGETNEAAIEEAVTETVETGRAKVGKIFKTALQKAGNQFASNETVSGEARKLQGVGTFVKKAMNKTSERFSKKK